MRRRPMIATWERWLLVGAAAIIGGAVCGAHSLQPPPGPVPSDDPVARLLAGATVEGKLIAGGRRRYPLPIAAGRYVRIEAEQKGVDVVLRLLGPRGQALMEADGWDGAWGPERVGLATDQAGIYILEVTASNEKEGTGPFTVRVVEQGAATPRNRLRVDGQRAIAAGQGLANRDTLPDFQEAGTRFESALRIFTATADPHGQVDALLGMGIVKVTLGEVPAGLSLFDRAAILARPLSDRRQQADVLGMRAQAYRRLGEPRRALDDLSSALTLWRSVPDSGPDVSRTLNLLMLVHSQLGDRSGARAYAGLVVRHARQLGDARSLCEALTSVGAAELGLAHPEGALPPLREALALSRQPGSRAQKLEPFALLSLGSALRALGHPREAREALEQALPKFRANGNQQAQTRVLLHLAATYGGAADEPRQRDLIEDSLRLSRHLGDTSSQASALTLLGRNALRGRRWREALRLSEEAVRIREEAWRLAPSPSQQSTLLARQFDAYELNFDALLASWRAGANPRGAAIAFTALERTRARLLQRQLLEAREEIRGDVPGELLARRRELGRQMQERAATGRGRASVAAASDGEALAAELRRVETGIERASPRYADLMLPQPITVEEVQGSLLDRDTVLLEYAIGRERSHVWAVGVSSVAVFELPKSEVVAAAVRTLVAGVSARSQAVRFETPRERRERIARADAQFPDAARALSRLVLAPVAPAIAGKRIVIVADGALHSVPWSALPDPAGMAAGIADQPLAAGHEIVLLPSAAVLRELRRSAASRLAPEKTLAVIADPVLDADDPRLQRGALVAAGGGNAGGPLALRSLSRPVSPGSARAWPRLPHAREEANAILAIPPATERLAALGFAANRSLVMGSELPRYRILHFATHAEVDRDQPELSRIVLSTFDDRGRPRNGSLSLFDVYHLRLRADVVVLSGCRTALGEELRGEGVVGLARGFMFAGAPRVVVSLWDVQDRATAALMQRFYVLLLANGKSPAAALREAQLAMAGSAEWHEPYYWAGFVVQGDWR